VHFCIIAIAKKGLAPDNEVKTLVDLMGPKRPGHYG